MAAAPVSQTCRSTATGRLPPVALVIATPSGVAIARPRSPPIRQKNGRLGDHEAEDASVAEAERLQDGQLGYALAHALRDRIADDEQQREEDREQDPAHDQADVADLLEEPEVEVLLGLGLGLVRGVLEHAVDRR